MKKIPLLIIISLALAVASCGNRTPRAGDEKTLTVTIPPIAWFVEAIAGDDFTINVMLPPGADHHIWEPLPAPDQFPVGLRSIYYERSARVRACMDGPLPAGQQ